MADADTFKALFPQFDGIPNDEIDPWIAQFPLRFSASRFGAQVDMATYYWVGHQLTTFPSGSDASGVNVSTVTGALTSDKVGDLSRSYGAVVDIKDVPRSLRQYASTRYGLELIGIILSRRHVAPRIVLTGSST